MSRLETVKIGCPYCGEQIDIIVDCSVSSQDYIEDCQVCCRPMNLSINIDADGDPQVIARDENE